MSAGRGSAVAGLAVVSGLATITLQAPHRRNALTPDTARGVLAALKTVNADKNVGALMVPGEGPAFCPGGDHSWIRGAAADSLGPAADHGVTPSALDVRRSPVAAVPTIAAGAAPLSAHASTSPWPVTFASSATICALPDSGGPRSTLAVRTSRCPTATSGTNTWAALAFFGQEMDAGNGRRARLRTLRRPLSGASSCGASKAFSAKRSR